MVRPKGGDVPEQGVEALAKKVVALALRDKDVDFINSPLFPMWATLAFGYHVDLSTLKRRWVEECREGVDNGLTDMLE